MGGNLVEICQHNEFTRTTIRVSLGGNAVKRVGYGFSTVESAFHLPEVCRQIYTETATLGYALNTFLFNGAGEFRPYAGLGWSPGAGSARGCD